VIADIMAVQSADWRLWKLPGQDSGERNLIPGSDLAVNQGPLAHALPTSHDFPADLAEVIEHWDHLPTSVRDEILGLVRSILSRTARGRD
jgi:hypothetical protein